MFSRAKLAVIVFAGVDGARDIGQHQGSERQGIADFHRFVIRAVDRRSQGVRLHEPMQPVRAGRERVAGSVAERNRQGNRGNLAGCDGIAADRRFAFGDCLRIAAVGVGCLDFVAERGKWRAMKRTRRFAPAPVACELCPDAAMPGVSVPINVACVPPTPAFAADGP